MLKSDNLAIRLGKMLVGLAGVALIVLLTLTVVFSFQVKSQVANGTAFVESCWDTGPITRRGIGSNWRCNVTFRDDKTGKTWGASPDMNLFTPDEIGKPQRISWGHGGSRTSKNSNTYVYHRLEGVSIGTHAFITVAACGVAVLPALWLFANSVIWSFTQEGQRKFWEQVNNSLKEKEEAKKAESG